MEESVTVQVTITVVGDASEIVGEVHRALQDSPLTIVGKILYDVTTEVPEVPVP